MGSPRRKAARLEALLACAFVLQAVSVAQGESAASDPPASPQVSVQVELSGLNDTYAPGDTVHGTITLRLDDPGGNVREAVAFLNVVEAREPWPQVAHRIVAHGEVTPEIFQVAFGRDVWTEGLTAEATLELREDAPPGRYDVVIQVFAGANTDPHRVDPDARLSLRSFRVNIEE